MRNQVSMQINGKEILSQDIKPNEAFEIVFSQSEDKRSLCVNAQTRDAFSSAFTSIAKIMVPSGDHIQIGHNIKSPISRRFNQNEIEKLLRLHSTLNPGHHVSFQLHVATQDSNFIIRADMKSDITCLYEVSSLSQEGHPVLSVGTLSPRLECEQWMKKNIISEELVELIYIAT